MQVQSIQIDLQFIRFEIKFKITTLEHVPFDSFVVQLKGIYIIKIMGNRLCLIIAVKEVSHLSFYIQLNVQLTT